MKNEELKKDLNVFLFFILIGDYFYIYRYEAFK